MEQFFTERLGLGDEVFSFIILPALIFLARIMDVSINTIRIIYVLGGRKMTATLLGFFESFIWLMAIRQIFEHLDNWLCYVAYPAGFATGIFVGMMIEERIAYGKVIVRIITSKDVKELISYIQAEGLRYTHVDSRGKDGPENLVFTVLERERLERLLDVLKDKLPTSFYTVEKVNKASESTLIPDNSSGGFMPWFRRAGRE